MTIESACKAMQLRTERTETSDQGGLADRHEVAESAQAESLQQRDRLWIDTAVFAQHTDAEVCQQLRAATGLDDDRRTRVRGVMCGHGGSQTTVGDTDAEDDATVRRLADDALHPVGVVVNRDLLEQDQTGPHDRKRLVVVKLVVRQVLHAEPAREIAPGRRIFPGRCAKCGGKGRLDRKSVV